MYDYCKFQTIKNRTMNINTNKYQNNFLVYVCLCALVLTLLCAVVSCSSSFPVTNNCNFTKPRLSEVQSTVVDSTSTVYNINVTFHGNEALMPYAIESTIVLNALLDGIVEFVVFGWNDAIDYKDNTIDDLRLNYTLREEYINANAFAGSINVFLPPSSEWLNGFVETMFEFPEVICTTSDYNPNNAMWVSDAAIKNHNTLAHEIGHHFFLSHVKDWNNTMNSFHTECNGKTFTKLQIDTIKTALVFRDCIITNN